MTAEEPIRPASEETRYCLTDRNSAWEPCYQQRLKLEQAEATAATIRERDEEIAKLQGIIMGTSTEARVTLGVNLRRYWSADDQVMLGRMLFDEDVPALRAELAAIKAQAEDATEYVLAVENRELRAERDALAAEVERLRANDCDCYRTHDDYCTLPPEKRK